MSIHPGENKTKKGPTKEMGQEEALEQTGEKKTKIKTLRTRQKRLSRRKKPTGSLQQMLQRPACFVLAVGLSHSLSGAVTNITGSPKDFQL